MLTPTHPRVKVRVTGERTGGGTSCQSCDTGVISRGAGFTEIYTKNIQNRAVLISAVLFVCDPVKRNDK